MSGPFFNLQGRWRWWGPRVAATVGSGGDDKVVFSRIMSRFLSPTRPRPRRRYGG
jgi:hypothetical protein